MSILPLQPGPVILNPLSGLFAVECQRLHGCFVKQDIFCHSVENLYFRSGEDRIFIGTVAIVP